MQLEPEGEHDPKRVGGKIPKEADGYYIISYNLIPLSKAERVLVRQS